MRGTMYAEPSRTRICVVNLGVQFRSVYESYLRTQLYLSELQCERNSVYVRRHLSYTDLHCGSFCTV